MTTATARVPAVRKASSSIIISKGLDDAVAEAAKSLKTTKAKLVRNAIINLLEDIEDIRDAKAVLAKRKKPIPLAQLKAELGLGN